MDNCGTWPKKIIIQEALYNLSDQYVSINMRGRKRCYENRAHEGRPRVDEVDGAELCREVGCPEEMSTLSSVNQGRPKAGDTIQQKANQRRALSR